jgi:hypothetical protein
MRRELRGFRVADISTITRLIFTMDFLSWTICRFLPQTSCTSSAESQKTIQSFSGSVPREWVSVVDLVVCKKACTGN